jgi:hypothetical protein
MKDALEGLRQRSCEHGWNRKLERRAVLDSLPQHVRKRFVEIIARVQAK